MCGIAGIVGTSDVTAIDRMLDVMAHRGPDDWGSKPFHGVDDGRPAVLGHRRLSIIDLGMQGHQPMSNEDGTLWVVFNGEIYNFRPLREVLERAGHRFSSRTDTEVLLHGYEEWGVDCVRRFTGMFAFAIWDTHSQELVLFRDRLGIKPLYYAHVNGWFVFASEIKAILEVPGVLREVDLESLDVFLSLGYIPGPRTLFRGIVKLEPGCFLRLSGDNCEPVCYWRLPSPVKSDESFEDQATTLRNILETVVADHLVSDVPLGSFLSGGLDSSVTTALMAKHLHNGRRPCTFCVTYEGDSERHDERSYAALVSRHVGTEHHEVMCTSEYAIHSLPGLIWNMDEPVAEELLAPYARLCHLARMDVTVALSGEGADEFLYGYRYYCVETYRRLAGMVPRPLRAAARTSLQRLFSLDDLCVRAASCCLQDTPMDSFLMWSMVFPWTGRENVYGDGVRVALQGVDSRELLRSRLACPSVDGADFAPAMDAKHRMVDYILSRTDKLSMAVALEVRVPFLDHRVVEFLARVPANHKIRAGHGKQLLRSAVGDLLPREIVWRRKKPFGAPVQNWVPSLAERYLANSALVADGVLSGEFVERIRRAVAVGRVHTGQAWAVVCLEVWYRIFIRRDAVLLRGASRGVLRSP